MKTWENYKAFVKNDNAEDAQEIALMETLASLLAECVHVREEKGLSQSDLAEIAGVKQSAISRMESMKSVPQVDTMLRILQPLGYKLVIAQA